MSFQRGDATHLDFPDEYFDVVEDFFEDMDFVPDEMQDTFDAKLVKAFD